MKSTTKSYSDLYLYYKGNYEKKLLEFLIKSEVITRDSSVYADMEYAVKRYQNSGALLKVLRSDNVVLIRDPNGGSLPRSFKVMAAKDIKRGDKKLRIFIDVSDILRKSSEDGSGFKFHANDIDILVSYLMNALTNLIYYAAPDKLISNGTLINKGATCFALLFTHVIDYLRLGGVDRLREKCLYLSALYYQINILQKDYTDTIESRALHISKLAERDAVLLSQQLPDDAFKNIETFVDAISVVLKAEGLRIDNFVEKWLFLYHSGTQFGLELYPAFSAIITNAYVGAYLNNQKLIEKICGSDMVAYSTTLLRIGSELR